MILRDKERRHLALDLIDRNMLIPEGLVITPKLWKVSIELYDTDNFGKTDKVICPFLNEENSYCNIHPYRNGVCSSFFCYPDYGELADEFWNNIGSFIGQSEAALSQWCMENNSYSSKEYFDLMEELSKDLDGLSNEDGSWSQSALKTLWKSKSRDEIIQYFENCAKLVEDNLKNLKEIVSTVELNPNQPLELAQLSLLKDDTKTRLNDEIRVEGKAVSIRDLEYSLKASSRNLNYLPFGGAKLVLQKEIKFEKNDLETEADKFYKNFPFKLKSKKNRIYYLKDKDKEILSHFTSQRELNSDLLDYIESQNFEPRSFIRRWVGRSLLEYVYS